MTPDAPLRFSQRTHGDPSNLRSLRSGEIIDEAIRTYRALAPHLLRRSAVPSVFVLAGLLFWTRVFWPQVFLTRAGNNVGGQILDSTASLILALLVATPLVVFGFAEATAQTVTITTDYREGRPFDDRKTGRRAREIFPKTLAAGLWSTGLALIAPLGGFGMMAFAGLLTEGTSETSASAGIFAVLGVLGVLTGFFISVWVLAAHALVPNAILRGESVRAAMKASRNLMKGRARQPGGYGTVWSIYFLMILMGLIEIAGLYGIQYLFLSAGPIPGSGAFSEAIGLAMPFVVAWTIVPFWGTVITILDQERRIRMEGYDVVLLAKG